MTYSSTSFLFHNKLLVLSNKRMSRKRRVAILNIPTTRETFLDSRKISAPHPLGLRHPRSCYRRHITINQKSRSEDAVYYRWYDSTWYFFLESVDEHDPKSPIDIVTNLA